MSDESQDDNRAWGTPAGRLPQDHPDDQEALTALAGRIDLVHPIGPLSLRARTRRPYILVAVAVAALLGGAGAALVVTGSGKPVPAHNASAAGPAPSSAPSPALPGAAGPGTRQAAPGRAADPSVLHGQYVLRQPGGGYQTIDLQNGVITAVSRTSVTLRSGDGFTHRYVVTRSTVIDAGHGGITSVKVGDDASVQATVTGSSATATSLTDLTALHHGSAL
jgi:hypothetical protein